MLISTTVTSLDPHWATTCHWFSSQNNLVYLHTYIWQNGPQQLGALNLTDEASYILATKIVMFIIIVRTSHCPQALGSCCQYSYYVEYSYICTLLIPLASYVLNVYWMHVYLSGIYHTAT